MVYEKTQTPIMKDLAGYIKPADIDKTLAKAAETSIRNWMLIYFAWRTGRRITEILKVQRKHINYDTSLILFSILKKKNKDYQKLKPVDDEFLEKLKEYTKDMKSEDYIFPSPYKTNHPLTRQQAYNIIRKTMEESKILLVGTKPPHPHVLRHSFAINFLNKTSNKAIALKLLSELLEHSKLEMTSTYLQFGQEDMKKELNIVFKP